jgi:hypothetical protein
LCGSKAGTIIEKGSSERVILAAMFLLDWINAILQALGLSNKQARIVVLGE